MRDRSPLIASRPVGPSARTYCNGALLIGTDLEPLDLLRELKNVERAFGRRPGGQRWRARVLDLDIVLWSGGTFAGPGLVIPHPRFRERDFVLTPVAAIAGGWRDPVSRRTVSQLRQRLTGFRPLPRAAGTARGR